MKFRIRDVKGLPGARAMRNALGRETAERMKYSASHSAEKTYALLGCDRGGLSEEKAEVMRKRYGANVIQAADRKSAFTRLAEAFVNPFSAILFVLAAVSLFTDVIFASEADKNPATVIIIAAMLIISGTLRFIEDSRSDSAVRRLAGMVSTTATVEREYGVREIPLSEVVVGDIVRLSAGDMLPADVRIIAAKGLFVSQSALTGESEPVEKAPHVAKNAHSLTECANLAFMGSNVVSGSGTGIVLAAGGGTMFGSIAKTLASKPPKTEFERGMSRVSWLLIKFMLAMVPVVLFINGFTKGDWTEALLFAVSVAVGLTPEMLPMIVTSAMAKGSVAMSRKKVIVKRMHAIQNLGAADILCTDKTGTLTQDKVVLERHMNVHGEEDDRVLRHAWLNSYFQTGLKNLIDVAVTERFVQVFGQGMEKNYVKTDEIPFDFSRRRMSVIITDKTGKMQLITKGAVEEMLDCCEFAEYGGKVERMTDELRRFILSKADELNGEGMRVIAVAQKSVRGEAGSFSVRDESAMVLMGYLAFLDPPKPTAARAIAELKKRGVCVKVLTGDSEKVTAAICRKVGLCSDEIVLGSQLDELEDAELAALAERVSVFAKLSPSQKARVVGVLRNAGHTVGYIGDGINDASAMVQADVGISVDTAVDIAKEAADIILLEKDLTVLEDGITEGRKTYANMIKYIKMTVASNFGNMLSVLVASAFLPFLPMAAIQLVLLNLIYDISCSAIPWDNVDEEYLMVPRKWEIKSIARFMLCFGPVSSLFDIVTFAAMYYIICPSACGGSYALLGGEMRQVFVAVFRAGWFIESMWTQTLIIHFIRTPKLPFIKSRASAQVTALTAAGIAVLTVIPFTPLGDVIGLAAPPAQYFALLAVVVAAYMALVTLVKRLYVRRFGELL